MADVLKIGIITVSDRGSRGEYDYLSGEEILKVLKEFVSSDFDPVMEVVPDEQKLIAAKFHDLCETEGCGLILTSGGTGPAPRDVTPEATESFCERMLPGFGELMRAHSMTYVKTAFLSRQTAGIKGRCLIVNLPGKPRSIHQCMEVLAPGLPHTLKLIGAAELRLKKGDIGHFSQH